MAGVKLTIQDTGVEAKLDAVINRLDDPAPLYRDIAELLLNSMRERFLTQTDPSGAPWSALSPDYLKSAEKKGSRYPTAIGRLNGYLVGQLVGQSSSQRGEVGSNREYAAMFQFGGSFSGSRVGHVKLATDSSGALQRNKRGGAVFAGKGATDFVHRIYATGYYESNQPGRPFAGFSAADQAGILAATEDYITGKS